MAIVTQQLTLDILSYHAAKPRIEAVQGDTGREILCSFRNWSAPSAATATIYVDTPEDKTESATCANNGDGTITAPLTAAMLATAGEGKGMIEITSGTIVTSFEFIIKIRDKIGA